jgi:hypothetical protein
MTMSISGTEAKGKAKRQLAETARKLASEGRWIEAVQVNQMLIERAPKDVDAFNRLGKAYFELGQYRSAYEAYQSAASLDPANIIAQRNMSRIEPLKETESDGSEARSAPNARMGVFIEEVGRTYVDDLVNVADQSVLTLVSSGDQLQLQVDGDRVLVTDADGTYIGAFEPRLSRRLIELVALGNAYEVFVTSLSETSVRVIVREAVKSPGMGSRLSFPRQGKVAIPRAYLRDTRLFRDEPDMLLGEDDDEDADTDEGDEFEASESDDEETEYIEEAGATVDEEEETI